MGNDERIRPPLWLKPANKVFIQMSKLGMSYGGEGPVVLTVSGRKSGVMRSTPMTVDGKRYVVAGFPGADLMSPDDARPLLRAFPTEVPTGVGFMKRSRLATDGRPEEFEALAGRCAIFRFEPVQS